LPDTPAGASPEVLRRACPSVTEVALLQQTGRENILPSMRIVDPETGRSYDEKRRVRYNEPGQPRELTFSCYHHHQFLSRDRTREWFCEALDEARTKAFFQLWAYVVMPVIDHIHANPVRRGLVARAADWEWSSARWYAGLRPVKLEMDHGVLAELARG
jgi:hypothetical protein